MRTFRYVLCDVFTDRPLTGNALAVFTDARGLDAETMQALAREMNLSETTFVDRPSSKEAHAKVRIFTPRAELPFAGHPTLGTAVVLGQPMQLEEIRLELPVGVVPVQFEREGPRITFGWMSQPLPKIAPFPQADALLAALGLDGSALPIELYDNGARHAIVVAPSREAVAALRPDLGRLAALPVDCFSVCAGDGTRWKTRMFAPTLGIAEDPATGGAAGPLAVHLTRHGRAPFGKEIVLEQGAEIARPSLLHARVEGTADAVTSVRVGGGVVLLGRGELRVP